MIVHYMFLVLIFYETKILNNKVLISNMVNKICNAFKYEYKNNQILSYEENLKI